MPPERSLPPLLEVGDRAELHAWLVINHATSPGVLLAVGNKGGTVTALTYEDAVLEGLSFGWIDSTSRKLDAHRHTVLFTPRRPHGTWARTNKARVDRLIAEGLMTPAGIAVIEAAKADGSWNALTDADDLVVPPDLAAALALDHAAEQGFAAAPAAQRSGALFRIASARRVESRARRIAEVVAAARDGGPLR